MVSESVPTERNILRVQLRELLRQALHSQVEPNETRFPDYALKLKHMGYNVFVGEIGWNNAPSFVRQQVEFLKANGIGFALWAIIGHITETDRLLIDPPNGTAIPTALGAVAQEALK